MLIYSEETYMTMKKHKIYIPDSFYYETTFIILRTEIRNQHSKFQMNQENDVSSTLHYDVQITYMLVCFLIQYYFF